MSKQHLCPFCAAPLLCHVRLGKPYWFCTHCHQEVPYGIYQDSEEGESPLTLNSRSLNELSNERLIDELTQLANCYRFLEYINHEWYRMFRDQTDLSLILCDVNFQEHGQQVPESQTESKYLQKIALAIRAAAKRPADLVARYRYQKFAVLLPSTPQAGAAQVAREINFHLKGLENLSISELSPQSIIVSLGLASTIPNSGSSPQILIDTAEQALIEAKAEEGNQIIINADLSALLSYLT